MTLGTAARVLESTSIKKFFLPDAIVRIMFTVSIACKPLPLQPAHWIYREGDKSEINLILTLPQKFMIAYLVGWELIRCLSLGSERPSRSQKAWRTSSCSAQEQPFSSHLRVAKREGCGFRAPPSLADTRPSLRPLLARQTKPPPTQFGLPQNLQVKGISRFTRALCNSKDADAASRVCMYRDYRPYQPLGRVSRYLECGHGQSNHSVTVV